LAGPLCCCGPGTALALASALYRYSPSMCLWAVAVWLLTWLAFALDRMCRQCHVGPNDVCSIRHCPSLLTLPPVLTPLFPPHGATASLSCGQFVRPLAARVPAAVPLSTASDCLAAPPLSCRYAAACFLVATPRQMPCGQVEERAPRGSPCGPYRSGLHQPSAHGKTSLRLSLLVDPGLVV